jgi:hypothetical protein
LDDLDLCGFVSKLNPQILTAQIVMIFTI